ncbi:MAG: putative rane protein [Rhodoglobus sp.]|jgi:hypothetical protein|nr:putative rane protein [Rhodoglobus sp.]
MPTITRTWLAFAAIGTGLIHFALVIGSPLGFGLVLAVLGLAEFGWGVLTFARETLVVPRVALAVALVPVVGWALLLVTSSVSEAPELAASFGFLPLAVASLFELFAVAVLGVHLRRRREPDAAPVFPSVFRYLLGLAVGAVVVAGLTTPALAATEAGLFSQPHGTTGTDEPYELNLPEHGH